MKWLKYLHDEQGQITLFKEESGGYVVQYGSSADNRQRVQHKCLESVCEFLAYRFDRDEILEGLEE